MAPRASANAGEGGYERQYSIGGVGVLVLEGGTLSSGSRIAETRFRPSWSRRLRFLEKQERRALHASGSRGNGRARLLTLGDGSRIGSSRPTNGGALGGSKG